MLRLQNFNLGGFSKYDKALVDVKILPPSIDVTIEMPEITFSIDYELKDIEIINFLDIFGKGTVKYVKDKILYSSKTH